MNQKINLYQLAIIIGLVVGITLYFGGYLNGLFGLNKQANSKSKVEEVKDPVKVSKDSSTKTSRWYLLKDSAFNFSIKLPEKPEIKETSINSEFGFIPVIHYNNFKVQGDPNLYYNVAITHYKGVNEYSRDDMQDFWERRKNGALENFNGTLLLEEKTNLNGLDGRKFRFLRNDKSLIMTMWAYLCEDRMYSLVVVTRRESDSNTAIYYFLKSFNMIDSTQSCIQQNSETAEETAYVEKVWGKNDCGHIFIPKSWKIYDDNWNSNITKIAGYDPTRKVTVARASDYDNSTFYIKLSTKQLEGSLSKNDVLEEKEYFLSGLDEAIVQITQKLKNNGTRVTSTQKARYIEVGGAYGGVYSYTYYSPKVNQTRTTEIYTLYQEQTFYNLTISWEKGAEKIEQIKNGILDKVVLCDISY